MNNYESQYRLWAQFFETEADRLSVLTTEEVYGLLETFQPQLEPRIDNLSPKKKIMNHKIMMTQ